MSKVDFIYLIPHLIIAGGSIGLMLVISFWRDTTLALWLTVGLLVASLAALVAGASQPAHAVGTLLVIDGYASFMSGLFLVGATATALFAHGYLRGRGGQQEEFYLLMLLATLGAMTVAAANHFAAFLIGLEILSISLYVLIGYSEEGHPPLEAALKYLVLSGVASTTMLFGIALIYNATGSLVIDQLADAAVVGERGQLYVYVGQAMLFAGVAFKLSLVPFHMWTPDVYQGAPAPVTGFLATVSKGAAFAFLLRFAYETDFLNDAVSYNAIAAVAVLSMIVGNVLALLQENVKRILAYSSIAHVGYLLIGLLAIAHLADKAVALEASMVYLTGYFLMTLAAFGVISVLSSAGEESDAESMAAFAGLFWRRPSCALIMTIALLSLTGIPLTLGFIVKFYMVTAGVEGGLWILLWALIVGSAIAVYYYLRIIFAMVRTDAEAGYAHPPAHADAMAALVLVGVALVIFGVYPAPLIDIVQDMLATTR